MFATGLCAALVLSACSHRDRDGHVQLDLWAFGREGEVVREILPEFESRNPGIRVRVQQIPWTAAHEKLLTAYVARQTPDVAQLGNTWIPELCALGAIAGLDEEIRRSEVVSPADYFAGVWATNVVSGAVYGIPWYVDTRVLFYRTDLLREAGIIEPPRTWDEWRAAMVRLRGRDSSNRTAILLPLDEWAQPVILALQAGSTLLRDGDRYGDFRGEAFARAARFYLSLFEDGLAPRATNTQIANLYQQFAQGEFAMYITGPWNLGEFRRRLPAEMRDRWSTAPLPGFRAGSPGVSLAGGSSLVVFRSSPHPREAWRLIEFLSEPARQARFYELTGDLPARKSAWSAAALAGDPQAEAFRVQLDHAVPMPKVPEWEHIAAKVAEHMDAAARDQETLDQALAALDLEVDQILEKRRWMLARGGLKP